MTRLMIIAGLLTASVAAAEPGFWQQMTSEQRQAAGVDQLTPEQRMALDAAAAQFAREGARKEVEVVKTRAQAEQVAAVQQAKVQAKEEAKAEVKAETRKRKISDAGLAARDDDETIRTRIAGDFRGWTGRTVFTLENGQVWQQTDKQDRYFPKMVDPEVELTPNRLFGWKMTLVAEGLFIYVKRVK